MHPTRPHDPRTFGRQFNSGAKHYGWHRHYNGEMRDARWKLVANKTGIPRAIVAAIYFDLRECANQAKPRGSIQDVSFEVVAVALDLEVSVVDKVVAALEDIGVTQDGWIVDWSIIQREKEDPTSTERSRRRRERLKKQREAAAFERLKTIGAGGNGACNGGASTSATDATPLYPYPSDKERKSSAENSQCNDVAGGTATPRSDQIKNGQAGSEDWSI